MGGRGARGVGKGKGGKVTSPSKYKGSLSNFGSKRIFLSYKNNSSRWERNMHVVGSNSGMKGYRQKQRINRSSKGTPGIKGRSGKGVPGKLHDSYFNSGVKTYARARSLYNKGIRPGTYTKGEFASLKYKNYRGKMK